MRLFRDYHNCIKRFCFSSASCNTSVLFPPYQTACKTHRSCFFSLCLVLNCSACRFIASLVLKYNYYTTILIEYGFAPRILQCPLMRFCFNDAYSIVVPTAMRHQKNSFYFETVFITYSATVPTECNNLATDFDNS